MYGTHLPVGILYGGDVGLPEGALDEAQDKGALANTASPKDDDSVVIALLGHPDAAAAGTHSYWKQPQICLPLPFIRAFDHLTAAFLKNIF